MKVRLLFAIASILIMSAISTFAQQTKWTRYGTDDGSFSALLPPGALVDAKKQDYGRLFRIFGFSKDVHISLVGWNADRVESVLMGEFSKAFKVGKSAVSLSERTDFGRFYVRIWIKNEKGNFYLNVEGPSSDDPDVVRTLLGLRIDGKPILRQEKPETDAAGEILFSKLITSPEVKEARERKLVKTKSDVTYEALTTDDSRKQPLEMSRPAIIVDQPSANLPGNSYSGIGPRSTITNYKTLNATARVTLLANGQIGNIALLGTPKSDFANSIAEAARKIRFVPAQMDGVNVDSERIVQYSYIVAVFSREL